MLSLFGMMSADLSFGETGYDVFVSNISLVYSRKHLVTSLFHPIPPFWHLIPFILHYYWPGDDRQYFVFGVYERPREDVPLKKTFYQLLQGLSQMTPYPLYGPWSKVVHYIHNSVPFGTHTEIWVQCRAFGLLHTGNSKRSRAASTSLVKALMNVSVKKRERAFFTPLTYGPSF